MSETMIRPETKTLVLHPEDNIAVTLANLDASTSTPQVTITAKRVPNGHKFTLRQMQSC